MTPQAKQLFARLWNSKGTERSVVDMIADSINLPFSKDLGLFT